MSAEMHRSQNTATVNPEAVMADGFLQKARNLGRAILDMVNPSPETQLSAGVITPHEAHRSETDDFEAVRQDTGELVAINPADALVVERRNKLEQANPSVYRDSNTPYQG